jgi:hypothetical protein
MPLRVPELAPSLGRLIVPRRLTEPWVPVDDIREELATRIIELAGEARSAMAGERRNQVVEALGRRAWLAAWEHAVGRATERVAAALDRAIAEAAQRVRMPERRASRRLLSAGERRAIHARLGSGAERFVDALDALDAAATAAREASVLDKEAHAAWQEALRTAARRLEAAWLALEEGLTAESVRWAPEIAAIARWRPSLWPVWALWIPVAAVLIWLGLAGGGYIPTPAWLATRLGF